MRILRVLKLAVFAVLPAALLVGGVELLLWGLDAGVRSPNVSRGFDESARYLLPHPDRPGAYRTQMFDGQWPEITIPRKGDAFRVVLFGGSNTQGFPWHHLRNLLNEDGRPGMPAFEVFNLGRSGYGSGRVSILFEQAMALEPDLVVIYTGHNEFVEAGFRMDLQQGWTPWTEQAAEVAARLRAFNVLVAALTPEQPEVEVTPAEPEAWKWEYGKFLDTTWDETLEHMERYRQNLEVMCRTAREHDVRVVLCTVTGNQLAAPFVSNLDPGTPPAIEREVFELTARVVREAPGFFEDMIPKQPYQRLHVTDWWVDEPHEPFGVVPPMRPHGPPFDARPGWWPPPGRWTQKVQPFLESYSRLLLREQDEAERAQLEAVRPLLERILELVPDHPVTLYRLGLLEYLTGDDARAVELLREAGRLDRAPRKANDLTNAIVREVAAEFPEVDLYDLEGVVLDRVPQRLIGFELMKDECHFHDKATPHLMRFLADEILRVVAEERP